MNNTKIKKNMLYDYSSLETRENTVRFLVGNSKIARSGWEEYWIKCKNYYDGEHDTTNQLRTFISNNGLPWTPSQCEDGFIHVETQIDPNVPEFEFAGRDNEYDAGKAKKREYVCRYITEANGIQKQNIKNERRLGIYGTSVWFVSWDMNARMGEYIGDIKISAPKVMQMFFDPNVTENIDDGEWVAFSYRMHKMKVARVYKNELKALKKDIESFSTGFGREDTEFMREEYDTATYDADDETLKISLFYFRQPQDGKKIIDDVLFTWQAGDIGVITLINDEEVKSVPKIWRKTGCDMFPFSVYNRVPNDDFLYGKSEVERIKDMMDATDREMSYAQLNDAFMANDIVLMEENALADDGELPNHPGAVVKTKTGKIDAVRRLGNLSGYNKANYDAADKFRDLMQSINGNFDAYAGKEPKRITTATGLAILNDRAKSRQDLKRFDRTEGFKRLYELCDYMALEYYDDDRIIFLGASVTKEKPEQFSFNSNDYRVWDDKTEKWYYPKVDVKINVGDGLKNSKAFTVQSLSELIKTPITPQNYKIVMAYLDLINIPNKQEIKAYIEEFMKKQEQLQMAQMGGVPPKELKIQDVISQLSPEEQSELEQNPELMADIARQQGLNLV